MRINGRRLALVLLCTALALVACGPPLTPTEELAVKRSEYVAELTSWTVNQEPVAEPAEAEATDSDAETDADADVDPDAEPAEQEVDTVILLDILMSTEGQGGLAGVTIDLTHVDENEVEKARRRMWVDTSMVSRGSGSQVTLTLEGLDYEAGDMFHVEVRAVIAEDERSEYREFDGL